jgi:hypothetical protein
MRRRSLRYCAAGRQLRSHPVVRLRRGSDSKWATSPLDLAATLEEVVEFYDTRKIGLTAQEKDDLVAFFRAL